VLCPFFYFNLQLDQGVDSPSWVGSFSMYMRCLHRSMDCRVAWILLDLGILGVLGQGVRMCMGRPQFLYRMVSLTTPAVVVVSACICDACIEAWIVE
jgi:hypothetical protein